MPRKPKQEKPVLELDSEPALTKQQIEENVDNIIKHVQEVQLDTFIRNEDGSVNWRKMIKSDYVVVKNECVPEIEKVYQKPVEEIQIESLDDKYLLIKLAGIKELAKLRGISSVTYPTVIAQPDFVSAFCQIVWKPFEKEENFVVFTDGADATPRNTNGFASDFLTAIACNRAFVRSVRNFLGIHIVGQDEVGSPRKVSNTENTQVNDTDPRSVLNNKIHKGGKTFEDFKKFWLSQGNPEAETWNDVKDIPITDVWTILGFFKQKEEQKKKS